MSTALLEPLLQTDDVDVAEWLKHPVIDGRPLNRWTPAQFDLMCELGLFDEDEVELFRGVVIRQMTRNTLHDVTLHLVAQGLLPYIPPGWIVRYQAAVIAGQSVLEPDLALVRGPHTLYLKRHPVAGDAGLIIEVSDSSLARDRLKAVDDLFDECDFDAPRGCFWGVRIGTHSLPQLQVVLLLPFFLLTYS